MASELKLLKPQKLTGIFDDSSEEVTYSGPWIHGDYPQAADGTLSYSDNPASSVRLSFQGTEITWVFTRAGNRGIASIKIDDVPRGDLNLYSPTIVWQSRTTFRNLPPGKHTIEVAVTGRKDPNATDQYIDIDALVVP